MTAFRATGPRALAPTQLKQERTVHGATTVAKSRLVRATKESSPPRLQRLLTSRRIQCAQLRAGARCRFGSHQTRIASESALSSQRRKYAGDATALVEPFVFNRTSLRLRTTQRMARKTTHQVRVPARGSLAVGRRGGPRWRAGRARSTRRGPRSRRRRGSRSSAPAARGTPRAGAASRTSRTPSARDRKIRSTEKSSSETRSAMLTPP